MATPPKQENAHLSALFVAMGEGIKYIVANPITREQRASLMGRARRLLILLKDEKPL